MAIFRITPRTSVFTDVFAFDFYTPGADTLIVEPGAFLISTGANGALLGDPTGAWNVTVNGSIVGQSVGILLNSENTVSTIKIGVDGEVSGGAIGISLAHGSTNISNAGRIVQTFGLGFGSTAIEIQDGKAHTITNSGEITALVGNPAIKENDFGSTSNDTVRNSGTINGAIDLTGGNDTVTNFVMFGDVVKSGTIVGQVSLGAGNDKFFGGINAETVADGDGADIVNLGGGNDTYIATGNFLGDGIDTVSGGAGVDTYDASAAFSACTINLGGASPSGVNSAIGTDIAGTAKDKIFGFENANGGHGVDFIFGTSVGNALNGGDGDDFLSGFGGKDTLNGGAGFDTLVGGSGNDQLTGGPGGDIFHYVVLSDSGITAATRDLITDFEQGNDKIFLAAIDAIKTNAAGTNDAFTFIGTNVPTGFSGHAGELRAFWTATGQRVEGDVNGDAKADFSIELQDPLHAITLTSGDFFL